jgi:catechol-2,3-dioxygenase
MGGVRRLNHAVLYVRDADRSERFYCDQLGFEVARKFPGAVFLHSRGSANDHDLGLFTVGEAAPRRAEGIGLYHLAWQVDTLDDLVEIRERLSAIGALVGQSDHGVSKSLYSVDPDGNEFEVMWAVPHDAWTEDVIFASPLDLDAELERWSGVATVSESSPGSG